MDNVILALPAECWRWVPGYEGLYQVSTRGRVRSVGRWVDGKAGSKKFLEGQILKPVRYKSGYLYVGLSRDGKVRRLRIHRLVAMAWLDNPDGKPEVNHLDEDKTNADVFNLSWVSRKANLAWGTGIERRTASQSMPVQALNPDTGQVVKEFASMMEAGRNGFSQGDISECCRGKKRIHKGLVWRFKER